MDYSLYLYWFSYRNSDVQPATFTRRCNDLALPMQVSCPLSDIDESDPIYLVVRLETDAIIVNDQLYLFIIGFEGHNHRSGSAVFYDVSKLFLQDTVNIYFLMVAQAFFIKMMDAENNIYFVDLFDVFNESFYTFEQGICLQLLQYHSTRQLFDLFYRFLE